MANSSVLENIIYWIVDIDYILFNFRAIYYMIILLLLFYFYITITSYVYIYIYICFNRIELDQTTEMVNAI